MQRYHPFLIMLHWLLAIMIITSLIGGSLMHDIPNSETDKSFALGIHMIFGVLILILMLVRLILRISTTKPERASTGVSILDSLSIVTHYAFYLLIFIICASGIGMAIIADLPSIIFGMSGQPLPSSFIDITPHQVHNVATTLLIWLIALHIVAVIYHQFKLKDRLFSRMWLLKDD